MLLEPFKSSACEWDAFKQPLLATILTAQLENIADKMLYFRLIRKTASPPTGPAMWHAITNAYRALSPLFKGFTRRRETHALLVADIMVSKHN
jgi:hypothetical protein